MAALYNLCERFGDDEAYDYAWRQMGPNTRPNPLDSKIYECPAACFGSAQSITLGSVDTFTARRQGISYAALDSRNEDYCDTEVEGGITLEGYAENTLAKYEDALLIVPYWNYGPAVPDEQKQIKVIGRINSIGQKWRGEGSENYWNNLGLNYETRNTNSQADAVPREGAKTRYNGNLATVLRAKKGVYNFGGGFWDVDTGAGDKNYDAVIDPNDITITIPLYGWGESYNNGWGVMTLQALNQGYIEIAKIIVPWNNEYAWFKCPIQDANGYSRILGTDALGNTGPDTRFNKRTVPNERCWRAERYQDWILQSPPPDNTGILRYMNKSPDLSKYVEYCAFGESGDGRFTVVDENFNAISPTADTRTWQFNTIQSTAWNQSIGVIRQTSANPKWLALREDNQSALPMLYTEFYGVGRRADPPPHSQIVGNFQETS